MSFDSYDSYTTNSQRSSGINSLSQYSRQRKSMTSLSELLNSKSRNTTAVTTPLMGRSSSQSSSNSMSSTQPSVNSATPIMTPKRTFYDQKEASKPSTPLMSSQHKLTNVLNNADHQQLMQKQFVVLKLEHLENVMSKILKQQEKNSEDLKSLNTSFVNTISNIEKRIQAQETSIASVLEKIDDQVLSQSEDLKKCFLSEYQRLYSDSNVQYNSLSEKLKMVCDDLHSIRKHQKAMYWDSKSKDQTDHSDTASRDATEASNSVISVAHRRSPPKFTPPSTPATKKSNEKKRKYMDTPSTPSLRTPKEQLVEKYLQSQIEQLLPRVETDYTVGSGTDFWTTDIEDEAAKRRKRARAQSTAKRAKRS